MSEDKPANTKDPIFPLSNGGVHCASKAFNAGKVVPCKYKKLFYIDSIVTFK